MMRWLALGSAILTWPLITFGAFVRLKGAGLACPDWPLCYGQLIPPPGYEIALEVGHRFVAAFLGILIVAMVILAYRSERYRQYRTLSVLSLVLVSVQGIFGGLTVTMSLEPVIVTTHLIGGNLTFAVLVYFAWRTFNEGKPQRSFRWPSLRTWSPLQRKVGLMCAILFVILASGGKNSTTYSGYSCSAFPGCHPGAEFSYSVPAPDGSLNVPDSFVGRFMPQNFNEWIHMFHRFAAVFGGSFLMFAAWRHLWRQQDPGLRSAGLAVMVLIPTEVAVGILNALYRIPVPVSALHTAIAATLVGILTYALTVAAFQMEPQPKQHSRKRSLQTRRAGVPA
jgi:cytochrome c oxidase assembly protein subunit 15